jgi:hypothetical protein
VLIMPRGGRLDDNPKLWSSLLTGWVPEARLH